MVQIFESSYQVITSIGKMEMYYLNRKVDALQKKRKECGQSVIEFILVTTIILVMIFAFLQLAWGIGWGHYVHYATFMASRAYFASHGTRQEQSEAAANTFRSLLKKKGTEEDLLSFIAKARTGANRDIDGVEPVRGAFIGTHPYAASQDMNHRAFSWAEGVQYNFEFRLFTLPLASLFIKDRGQIKVGEREAPSIISWNGKIGLASDAWLGREVSTEECKEFLRTLSQSTGGKELLFDNGC